MDAAKGRRQSVGKFQHVGLGSPQSLESHDTSQNLRVVVGRDRDGGDHRRVVIGQVTIRL